ncbi:MAG: NUDIX hydrolase [Magnetococcales bacterium]|nr:NUDIX hydrolase [Magnetococcales bacterium]
MQEHPDYYYQQSAVIPCRQEGGELKILLITSRKKRRWVIPKGIIEPNLIPPDSAAKEALEEAGVQGKVSQSPIGTYKYDKWGGTCDVQVFVMEVEKVLDDWMESFRDRAWMGLEEAMERMEEKKLRIIMNRLPDFLAGRDQTTSDQE